MILHTLKNLKKYSTSYHHLEEAIQYLEAHPDFSLLKEGKNEVSENVYIVKVVGEKKSDFEGVLEVHKEWIDIHIPLSDDEIIVYKALEDCKTIEKEYDTDNDYMLYREDDLAQLVLPMGYFCIIDTSMCHMAMLGEGKLEKLIVKFRK
jgi:biofilm protein TabA